MSDPSTSKPGHRDSPAIEESSCVRLCADFEVSDRGTLPGGSLGTVVSVYGGGKAYFVEFEQPFHVLVTLDADQILTIPGAARADFDADLRSVLRRSG